MIRLLVALFLLMGFAPSSFAGGPLGGFCGAGTATAANCTLASPDASCAANPIGLGGGGKALINGVAFPGTVASGMWKVDGTGVNGGPCYPEVGQQTGAWGYRLPVCAPPSTLSANGSCGCPSGQVMSPAGVCGVPPPPPPDCSDTRSHKATQTFGTSYPSGMSLPTSEGGCKVEIESVVGCYQSISTSVYSCQYIVHKTGAPVDGPINISGDVEPNSAPAGPNDSRVPLPPVPPGPSGKCPAGAVQGGTDSSGIPICIGSGTAPSTTSAPTTTTKPPVVTPTPDGGSSSASTTTQSNSDGSTTTKTTTTTTAADGSVTVSQTQSTTAASGAPAGTIGKSDEPEDKSDLCKQHPDLAVCKNSSVTGSCAAIACEGDAIQCATLRAAAAMECKGRADDEELKASSMHDLGAAIAAGNDPMKGSFPTPANGTVVQAPSSLDDSGWLGGGSCFADKSFVVMGHTIVMPFSKTCDSLLVLRYALMVVAALVSFKIISGAILT